MAADRNRVIKRVTEMLNICAPGTYSATLSARNKTRNADAIEDFVDEAGLMVLKALAERPNEFRYQFAATQFITVNGIQISPHIGPPISVRIQLYADGPIRDGKRLNFRKITSYRENPQKVYDSVTHNLSSATEEDSEYTVYATTDVDAHSETPAGVIDGVNMTFTLTGEPIDNVIILALNGVVRTAGVDYTVAGSTITMTFAPQVDDELSATYFTDAGTVVAVPGDEDGRLRPSRLAGFYDIWNDLFYFTGYRATLQYARLPQRSDTSTLIPEIMENTWIRLSMGEAGKIGLGGYEAALIGEYGKRGMLDLEEFKTGKRQFMEIDDPEPQTAIHNVQ